MECMCAQTKPWFILSSERVLGNEIRTHVNSMGKIPSYGASEQDRTCCGYSEPNTLPTQPFRPRNVNRPRECGPKVLPSVSRPSPHYPLGERRPIDSGREEQTLEHVLQRCSLYEATREDVWPVSTSMTTKLYGCRQELEKTTSFISRAALIVQTANAKKKKKTAADQGVRFRLSDLLSRWSHAGDLLMGTPEATCAWRYTVGAGTGLPGVSIMWQDEIAGLICTSVSIMWLG